jgi:hypothetical protein
MYRSRITFALAMVAMAAILVPSFLTAQTTFQRTYGGASYDNGFSVQQTAEGGYVVAGGTRSFGAGDCDVYLIKVNALGDTMWTRTYGGAGSQGAYSVQQTADGGYVMAGSTADTVSLFEYGYLVRTDSIGETLWTRTFGPDSQDIQWVNEIQQTDDGGFVFVGWATGDAFYEISYVVRTDANGDTLWTRGLCDPESGYCRAYSVQQTKDHGYIVSGAKSPLDSGYSDTYLVKLDSGGGTTWSATFGDTGYQTGYSVEQTADGGYIAVGASGYSDQSDGHDVYLVRTDAAGNPLWTKVLREANDQAGNTVHQTPDGGFALCGWTGIIMTDSSSDAYLVRTDANGDTLWTTTFGGSSKDVGCSFQPTGDGGYVIAGYTSSFGTGGEDVWLIKTDSFGNVASVAEPKTGPVRVTSLSLRCEPNPCRGATMVSFQPQAASTQPATLRVYDSQGRVVHSEFGLRASSFRLDLRSMPAGTYFCRLEAGDDLATAVLLKL